jgi:hypothetical protein
MLIQEIGGSKFVDSTVNLTSVLPITSTGDFQMFGNPLKEIIDPTLSSESWHTFLSAWKRSFHQHVSLYVYSNCSLFQLWIGGIFLVTLGHSHPSSVLWCATSSFV